MFGTTLKSSDVFLLILSCNFKSFFRLLVRKIIKSQVFHFLRSSITLILYFFKRGLDQS
jgi:hypothetical protein